MSLRDPAAITQLTSVIEHFASLRHITPRKSADGFLFPIDDEFNLRCSTHRHDVIFEATISQGAMQEDVLQKMLRVNLGRQKEHHDMLSYDAKEDAIILYMRHPLRELDVHQFAHIFDQMNVSLRFWQQLKDSYAT